jgi:bacillithiol biosynthesis deacetylase BshB1
MYDFEEPLDVLVVAPHPDDAELGVGGTILRLLAQGWRVGVLDLTDGEPTPHGSIAVRLQETAAATEVLNLTWRHNLALTNRELQADLDSRRSLAEVFRLTRPRWIFAPFWEDAHPDHVAASQLVEDARFWAKLSKTDMKGEPFHPQRIFYYYCVHLKMVPQPAFVVDISEYCEAKLRAVACYASQFISGREHIQPPLVDRLREEAGFWGKVIGTRYGEPIASREPLGLTDFSGLV